MSIMELLQNPGFVTFFLPAYIDSKFPRSGKNHLLSQSLKADEAYGPKELSSDISALTRSSKGLSTYCNKLIIYPMITMY